MHWTYMHEACALMTSISRIGKISNTKVAM